MCCCLQDLLVGTLSALLIFFTFIRYIKDYDLYLQTQPFAAIVLLVTALALCTVCYPSDCKFTSKGDAVQIVSAVAGCNIGCWVGVQMGWMAEPEVLSPYVMSAPTLAWVGMATLRFVTGLAIVLSIYLVLKWSTIRFFSYLQGLEVPDKTNITVCTNYKFVTYGTVGFVISIVVPMIHQYFGIHRPAVFTEVL